MNVILMAVLLATSASDLRERVQRSVNADTGGEVARFALCKIDAVEEFVDGHQTPDLVTDEAAWEVVLREKVDIPIDAPVIERERESYREFWADFDRKRLGFARAIAKDPDSQTLRRQSKENGTETEKISRKIAAASLERVRKALPRHQQDAFVKFLEERRRVTIVVRFDYTRIKSYACP